jgi:DNA primase
MDQNRTNDELEIEVEKHVVLRRVGSRMVGPCPFHQNSPTDGRKLKNARYTEFGFTPGKGFYYCFGCAATGDVAMFRKFIAEHKSASAE